MADKERLLSAVVRHRRDRAGLGQSTSTAASARCSATRQGHPRAAQRHGLSRRPDRAARPRRDIRRPARLHLAPRRRGADQRVQLPGVGHAGEAGADVSRRLSRPSSSPPSQTAYLTELVVRRIIDSGLLPDGSLQLVCGSPARLARPARRAGSPLRSPGPPPRRGTARRTRTSLSAGVQFNAEADSLNCSILGTRRHARRPRIRPLRQAARRRDDRQGGAEVHRHPPRPRSDGTWSTTSSLPLAPACATVVVGKPAMPTDVTMGALASLTQRDEVLQSLYRS